MTREHFSKYRLTWLYLNHKKRKLLKTLVLRASSILNDIFMVPTGNVIAFYILPKHKTVLIRLNITAQHGLSSQIKIHKNLSTILSKCFITVSNNNHRKTTGFIRISCFKKNVFCASKIMCWDVEKHEPDINRTQQHGADATSGQQLKTTQSCSSQQTLHRDTTTTNTQCWTTQWRQTKTTMFGKDKTTLNTRH